MGNDALSHRTRLYGLSHKITFCPLVWAVFGRPSDGRERGVSKDTAHANGQKTIIDLSHGYRPRFACDSLPSIAPGVFIVGESVMVCKINQRGSCLF